MPQKIKMDLQEQKDFAQDFYDWFDSGLRDILEDNRRRYRMRLKDEEERAERGLSALPSTKSTSVVDKAVDKALQEYHIDPDAISYTAKSVNSIENDMQAKWLTQLFIYRSKYTFPFFTWHAASLTAGFADGLEAAMVSWRKESYKEKKVIYRDNLAAREITEDEFLSGSQLTPGRFVKTEVEEEVVVKDTWWIDQLNPGVNLLWDFKIPLLDVNLGQVCLVKLFRTADEILNLADRGVFNNISPEVLDTFKAAGYEDRNEIDNTRTTPKPETVESGDFDRIEVWAYFKKIKYQWYVVFSLKGKEELSSPKKVNDVFFNGRRVNRLPVVMGTCKQKLWEAVGRSLPETIASIEDEYIDHRNNINDAAKQLIQGRWRVTPDSDVNIDDLLNARSFYASEGEVELIKQERSIMESIRAADAINGDINELVPVGMETRNLVPKGTEKTLGALQLALGGSNEKLSTQLTVRNQTFMEPLLWLLAQLEFAHESDEMILRIAGANVQTNQFDASGQMIPFQPPATVVGGQLAVDLGQLDFDINIQINAGMGSQPRQQKFNNLVQLYMFAKMLNRPVDVDKIWKQGVVLAGYTPDQFDLATLPEPPKPRLSNKLMVHANWIELPVDVQGHIVEMFKNGEVEVDAQVEARIREMLNNQMPNTAGEGVPDMTEGEAAEGMSAGGQGGYK